MKGRWFCRKNLNPTQTHWSPPLVRFLSHYKGFTLWKHAQKYCIPYSDKIFLLALAFWLYHYLKTKLKGRYRHPFQNRDFRNVTICRIRVKVRSNVGFFGAFWCQVYQKGMRQLADLLVKRRIRKWLVWIKEQRWIKWFFSISSRKF